MTTAEKIASRVAIAPDDNPPVIKTAGRLPMSTPGYEPLKFVLEMAYEQSASGKGKRRHANGAPFIEQDIMEISRRVGTGGPAFQVEKKVREALGMENRGEFDAAKNEILGAIVYAAAMWLTLDHKQRQIG